MTNRAKGIAAITASAFGFALMAAAVRLCDDCGTPVSSIQKAFFRNAVALAIAVCVFFRNWTSGRGAPWLPPGTRRLFVLRASLGTLGIFANFYALSRVTIAEGQTLNKTAPFFTVVFAWLFFGERATRRHLTALLVAATGMLLVAKPGFAGSLAFPLAAGLFGGACAGGAYACLRALRRRAVDPSVIVLLFSAFSCLATVPFLLARFDPMTARQTLVLVGAGAGAALGQFGITLAYGYAAPREIAVYDYSNILFTALLGFLLFGQVPDVWSFFGFVLIVLAAFRIFRLSPVSDGGCGNLLKEEGK